MEVHRAKQLQLQMQGCQFWKKSIPQMRAGITETRRHVQTKSSPNLVTEPTCNYTSTKRIVHKELMPKRSYCLVNNTHGHKTLVETFAA